MKQLDLIGGKVGRVLIALALPIIGSSLLQFTYNLVDMLWVGHLGSDAVASIGASSFFTALGYAINALFMVGTGIKVAHSIGKNQIQEAREYTRIGIVLSGIIGLIYVLVLLLGGKGLIAFLYLNDMIVENQAYVYLAWCAPMLWFASFNNIFSRVFASMGNTKTTFKINAIGIGINIILDPIFIYVFKWGVGGAAIATFVANIVMFCLYIVVGRDFFSFSLSKKLEIQKVKEIVSLGTPMAVQRILFTLINIMLAKLIASFGADAVAAQKIGVQIESITYMVTGGLNGAVASFIGQNYGAQNIDRLKKGYQTALGIGIVYASLVSLIFWMIPEVLIRLFVEEVGTITIAAAYLRIIAYSQIFNAMEMVSNGFLTGIGKPKIPSVVSVFFTALRLPIAYICVQYLGVNGIWLSITLSTILKGMILCSINYFTIRKLNHC